MRKFLTLSIIILCLIVNPAYSAPDDDSTPYNPSPEPPAQPQNNNQTPKKTVRKVRAKKPAPKPKPKKVIKPAPKPDYLQQAKNLLEQGRYKDAKPYLLKAIQNNRKDANVWYWYGKYHEYIGSFAEAQYYYTKAIHLEPGFEPLSRVVYYPNDPLKTPLWDPKRPARIYPVETSGQGITTIPPNARDRNKYPAANNDPQVPHVPVYTPPEPGATPLNGDSWSPSVYVPPAPDEIETQTRTPAYIPPSNSSIITEESSIFSQVSADPIIRTPMTPPAPQVVRADKPLYNPPEPGQQVTTKTIKQPRKPTPAKTPIKRAPVKVKTKTKSQPAKTPAKVEPQKRNTTRTPATPTRPTQPAPQTTPTPTPPTRQQTPAPRPTPNPIPAPEPTRPLPPRIQEPEVEPTPRPQQQYLPPVGQYSPDPGTISETPIPPVGQGNQE